MRLDLKKLHGIADVEVASVLDALPEPLQAAARSIPVLYESRPGRRHQSHGIECDTLGLFVGLPLAQTESGSGELAAHIILFLENLWDCAEGEETMFRKEVRITFLHELGHYLGLDEDGLLQRGL
jgi:predicted Zn-dependent protease with MMP-like domain